MIIYSAFADEYAERLEEQIEGLILNKIKNLEIRFIDGINVANLDNEAIYRVNRILSDNDINVFSIGSPIGKISIEDDFNQHLCLFERICYIAKSFGTKNIRIFSFYNKTKLSDIEYRYEVYSRVEKLLNIAEKYNVVLCHENEEGIFGESPESSKELLDYFRGRLKCVFDMGNFILQGYDPVYAYELLYEYIEYFHIKDGTKDGVITVPGYGNAKIKEIINDFDSKNEYTYITIEPHLMGFVGLNSLTEAIINHNVSFKSNKEAFNFAVKSLKKL